MKIYILSTYGEYGAENVMATDSKEKMIALKEKLDNEFTERLIKETTDWKEPNKSEYLQKQKDLMIEEMETLKECLNEDVLTGKTTGQNLASGWGGYMLHIIELV
jgi:hypothetical protein